VNGAIVVVTESLGMYITTGCHI